MLRLDRHKSSLSLMLNIVQCESDREAEQSQQSLLILVQQLVESNMEISRRLKTLETTFETESTLTACFRNGHSVETGGSEEAPTDQSLEISQRTTSIIFDNSSTSLPSTVFHSAFETDLNDSRVYKRTQLYECDVSFTSSAVRSHSWSIFSGLSLSQISSISMIALPVYSHEIVNKEWYGFVFFDQPDSQGTPTSEAGDLLNIEVPAESRTPAEMMAGNNTEDENHDSDRSSVAEEEGERLTLASMNPQPPKTGAATNPVFQPIETNMSKIQPYVPSPVISGPVGRMSLYKLVVLGDGGVGKPELVYHIAQQHIVETYDPTIEDSYRKQVVIDGQSCMLEILDTEGQEEYTGLRNQWIRDGEGFLLVYSISNRSSFTRIPRFYNQIQLVKEASASSPSYPGSPLTHLHDIPAKMTPIMLVGNRSDRVTEREVSTKEGYDLARELGCDFVEASVKNDINVEKAFYDVVRQLIQLRRGHREQMLDVSRKATQGHYAPRQNRRQQMKAGGVSQVWQRVRARAS